MTNAHRTQPILDAVSLEVVALEVLSRGPLPFDDEAAMIEVDFAALQYAAALAESSGLRVHCNVEYPTLVLAPGLINDRIKPGIVVELVERHAIFQQPDIYRWIAREVAQIRRLGALVAMDDVTSTTLERELIKALRPDLIKVENRDALMEVCRLVKRIPIIAERIETGRHAELARELGAAQIQGYWCDRIAQARLAQIVPSSAGGPFVLAPA